LSTKKTQGFANLAHLFKLKSEIEFNQLRGFKKAFMDDKWNRDSDDFQTDHPDVFDLFRRQSQNL